MQCSDFGLFFLFSWLIYCHNEKASFFFFFNDESSYILIHLVSCIHSNHQSNCLLFEPQLNIIGKSSSIITLFVPHSELVSHTNRAL